ncbi:MAG TPA: VOC family protein [Steroidobacteraceae bacterium]|jgi:catechol 2,3-dioxygenase-like lactoylglutathione lyase family enzyme
MSGAPLPLLGTFHELSLAVPDVRASVDFYERLGFTQASTADTFTHPYGVLTDGRLVIGLHQRPGPSTVLTFVRPGVAGALPAFAEAALELTVCRTGDEVFNEVGFEDPFGHAVAVLEARTYSPTDRRETEVSLCGDFAEVSLPASDFGAAQAFWEPLGFVAAAEGHTPYPHLSLTSDHLDVTFHKPRLHLQPLLVFREPAMAERIGRLREQGFALTALADSSSPAAFLESPDGTTLLLVAGDD